MNDVNSGRVRNVTIAGRQISGVYSDNNTRFETYAPDDPDLIKRLSEKGVGIEATPPAEGSALSSFLFTWLPMFVLLGVWIFFMRQMQGGGGKAMGFGKSKAKLLTEEQGRVTFEDVAGVDEAKDDLEEIVDFLRSPQKYQRLGGKIPHGVLLVGPPGTGKTLLARAIAGENIDKAADLGVDRWLMYHFADVKDLADLAGQFRADKSVQAVSMDWIAYPAAVPSDPLYADHWGHNNTVQLNDLDWGGTYGHTLPGTVGTAGFDANAEAAWDGTQGFGSSSVVIAILDSGVEVGHPDLNQVAGYDYGDNDSNPDDNSASAGHGTACAGVAASMNNSLGAVGIAGGCSIMPLKVADSAGSMFFSAIQNAIYHAADNGADVISLSLGAAISSDSATDAALLYAYNAGCTILAATGNENASTISYPAINQYVISVGAASPCGDRKRSSSSSADTNPGVSTDPNGYTCDGERWWGSNYGTNNQDTRQAVDILGPTILPTTDIMGSGGYDPGDYSGYFNGTSCATPYVAGVAALVISKNPSYTPAQVRDALVTSAQDVTNVESGSGWDRYSGYGMVDAAAAVGSGGGNPVAPTAEFSGAPTSGTFPLSVSFTDASTDQPTSWSWTFGDGGTSTSQNPSYTYTTAGSFNVTLTATNAQGSDGETKNGYITTTDPGDTYASLPYSTGFEGGAVDQYWALYEGAEGRIEVTTANSPHGGSYHLVMDDHTNGGSYSQNEGWLQLNLAGESQVDLDFWWKDYKIGRAHV